MNRKLWKFINLIALALVLTTNYLANALPINGLTSGEVSDRFAVAFTPAGYVFSIWGVIYLGLIAFGIYQLFDNFKHNSVIRRISPWFVLSCLFNSAWILTWHYLYIGVSLGVIILLLLTLSVIYYKLNQRNQRLNHYGKVFVKAPFSIYLAWISVATIANIFVFFDYRNLNDWLLTEEIWTALIIGVAMLIALYFVKHYRDFLFGGVFIWAYIGISVENNSGTLFLEVLPLVAAGIILIGVLVTLFAKKKTSYL